MIFLTAYLLGCIQSGVLISKVYNICDPRLAGSNNIGATNMWRLHGWKFGVATFIFDVLKIFLIYVIG
ncbi:MAG: glycerol-3-phosphate acyltransferase, partial [Gammaproteobacteria bacterium]|nr:glycerol-3-phosphate acyltransferase [Gammaproteobacteria bacterium]